VLLSISGRMAAQDFAGYIGSQYSGVQGVYTQPASVADSRYLVDVNLIGFGFNVYNNCVAVDPRALTKPSLFNEPGFDKNHISYNLTGGPKSASILGNIYGPGFIAMLGQRSAFGLTTRFRTGLSINNVSNSLVDLSRNGFDEQSLLNVPLNEKNMRISTNTWAEYGFTWGQVVKAKGKHFVKVGGTIKLLQGISSAYLYADDVTYSFKNKDTMSLFNAQFGYGHAENFDWSNTSGLTNFQFMAKPSVGFDLGAVYEFRPNVADGELADPSDPNKYKLRLGLSILDVGRLKYKKYDANDFNANINNWALNQLQVGSIAELDSTFKNTFGYSSSASSYKVSLPTTISVQADYAIVNRLFLNFNAFMAFNPKKNQTIINGMTNFTLSPRYEGKLWGIYLPQSINRFGKYYSGVTLRLGPFVIGSNTIIGQLIQKKNTYGLDIHAGVRIPILYAYQKLERKAPPIVDRDGDGLNDTDDACPDIAGPVDNKGCPYPDRDADGTFDKDDDCPDVAGKKDLRGCPDRDDDGTRDGDDRCPDIAGVLELQGCPDRDADGVADLDDLCPDKAGEKSHSGCPDTDGDGIYDNEDACVDVKGLVENKGCPYADKDGDGIKDVEDACPDTPGPFENKGCPWSDLDNDGVFDKDDDCPKTPGPVENRGCPKIDKREQEVLDYAFQNLEFETGKAIIRTTSFESLNRLADLLVSKPTYKLKISGHTDNVGNDASNMTLSKNRANAVKKYLQDKGVKGDNLMSEWFGETKPIDSNDTPAGRQRNRRVEMKVVFE
jgi:outer membrane protein OmpA-like peptidoglycan-associated protein